MKTYSIELRRTSFITLTIEAESKDKAEQMAWDEIQSYEYHAAGADWEIGFIDELSTDDDSRSFGPK
jgi:hypothetical protein